MNIILKNCYDSLYKVRTTSFLSRAVLLFVFEADDQNLFLIWYDDYLFCWEYYLRFKTIIDPVYVSWNYFAS